MAEKVADFYGALGMKVDEASFASANKILSTIKTGIAAFVGFKITQGITNAIGDVIELGGKFNDASQKTGVAAENLQAYGYAAGLAGASTDEVIQALGKMNKGLAEVAATGKGPAADALKSIGIGLNDPAVKAQNLDEILLEVADKFQQMPDGPKKVAAAMNLFGKAGANLIPFLNQGGDGINALKKEASDLGVVLDKDTIGSLDDLGDNIDKVKAGWQGFKNQAVAAIAPLIAEMLPALIDFMKSVVAWTRNHKVEIVALFQTIVGTIKFVFDFFKELILLIVEIVKFVVWLVTKIVQGVIAIGKFFYQLGKSIVTAIGDAFTWVVNKVRSAWNTITGIGRSIVDGFVAVGHGIIQAFRDAFDWVVNKAKEVGKTLRDLPVIKQLGDFGVWVGRKTGISDNTDEFNDPTAGPLDTTATQAPTGPTPVSSSTPTLPTSSGANGPVSVNNVIHVTPGRGMDEQALAEKVGDVVDQRMSAVFRHVAAGQGIA